MGVEIVVLLRGRVLARSDFAGAPVRIGRSPENEVFIDNLGLSRHHAAIFRDGGVWTLEDLGSSSGTFVNGQRVTRWHLTNGDRIGVGKFTLVFHARESVPRIARALGGGTVAAPASAETPRDLEARSPLVARLALDDGTEHVLATDVWKVGSDPASALVLKGWRVPAHVALVARTLTGFCAINVAGGDWLLCNEKPVVWEAWLADGDRLRLGRTEATFRASAAATAGRAEPCRT